MSSSINQIAKGESKGLIFIGRNGNSSILPINGGIYCFHPGMSKDGVFLSPIDDIEPNLLNDVSKVNVEYCFKATDNIGGLVGVSNGKGALEVACGDVVFVNEIPVNAIYLGS